MSSRDALIDKLEEISSVFDRTVRLAGEIKNFQPEDHYERTVQLPPFPGVYESEKERDIWVNSIDHSLEGAPKEVLACHIRFRAPKEPEKPVIEPFKGPAKTEVGDLKEKKGLLFLGSLILGALTLLIGLTSLNSDMSTAMINLVLCGGCAVYAFWYYILQQKAKKADAQQLAQRKQQYDQTVAEQNAKYQADMEKYRKAAEAFQVTHQEFAAEYAAWREIYIQHKKEESIIREKLEADREAAVKTMTLEDFAPMHAKLQAINDLVPEEYLPELDTLIDLIRRGRADSVKEAINLHEDILFKERQLELQREQEEQRRREEAQRREDEERRHREEMYRRDAAERQRQQDEERRHREEMDQRAREERNRQAAEREAKRQQEKAELERKRKEAAATSRQCNACALAGRCSLSHTRANCASFRPR